MKEPNKNLVIKIVLFLNESNLVKLVIGLMLLSLVIGFSIYALPIIFDDNATLREIGEAFGNSIIWGSVVLGTIFLVAVIDIISDEWHKKQQKYQEFLSNKFIEENKQYLDSKAKEIEPILFSVKSSVPDEYVEQVKKYIWKKLNDEHK